MLPWLQRVGYALHSSSEHVLKNQFPGCMAGLPHLAIEQLLTVSKPQLYPLTNGDDSKTYPSELS